MLALALLDLALLALAFLHAVITITMKLVLASLDLAFFAGSYYSSTMTHVWNYHF